MRFMRSALFLQPHYRVKFVFNELCQPHTDIMNNNTEYGGNERRNKNLYGIGAVQIQADRETDCASVRKINRQAEFPQSVHKLILKPVR